MSLARRRRGFLGVLAIASIAIWSAAGSAHAEFGPIQLVSKSATEQADEAFSPAISGDGQFVAFVGRLGGRAGLFRKNLGSGAITLVAELPGPEELTRADPSISADGRYVAFTTKLALAESEEDDPEENSSDVYVADLSTSPPTYELASAADGSEVALPGGSTAAARVALSEGGRRVAFLNEGQVYVRELGTTRTILITVKMGGTGVEPVPGGGADPASEGAAISGDGTTVAWVGSHLPEQVPMLPDEEAAVRALEERATSEPRADEYHEPLWRRLPSPPEEIPRTRRVVGGGDPLAPGCPPGGTLSEPACQGPFPDLIEGRLFVESIGRTEGLGWGTATPQLDRNGEAVAFVANPDEDRDLFVVDMAPGLDRREAVRRLTKWVNPVPGAIGLEQRLSEPQFAPMLGPIRGVAISPDGDRIAFTSSRQVYPLAPPSLVTPPTSGLSQTPELFQVDLAAETIERLTPEAGGQSWEGGLAQGETPSYSDDGLQLAFASKAFNLVEGDANEAADVFVVESPPASSADETAISRRPSEISVKPVWRMTASASSLRDGRVRLVVGLPGAGTVRAKAVARLGRRSGSRGVASAHRGAKGAGVQRFTLRLPKKLRGLAHRKAGLNAELDIDFTGSGGKPLSAALDVRFLVHRAKGKHGNGGKKR